MPDYENCGQRDGRGSCRLTEKPSGRIHPCAVEFGCAEDCYDPESLAMEDEHGEARKA